MGSSPAGPTPGRMQDCYTCGQGGHYANDCPRLRSLRTSSGRTKRVAKDSPEYQPQRKRKPRCHECRKRGHLARDCENPDPWAEKALGRMKSGGSSCDSEEYTAIQCTEPDPGRTSPGGGGARVSPVGPPPGGPHVRSMMTRLEDGRELCRYFKFGFCKFQNTPDGCSKRHNDQVCPRRESCPDIGR